MNISPLYTQLPENLNERISDAVHSGIEACAKKPVVFFRADDIGVPSLAYFSMVDLFIHYNIPLCLAVVPTWLTSARAEILLTEKYATSQFCYHQHGWRHMNYENEGKKQEFGDSRSKASIFNDIQRGKIRLESLLGDIFTPFFTPPWNRCGIKALESLDELNFFGVSRSRNARPEANEFLPDLQVNVDLHTRKEESATESFDTLLQELERSLAEGISGIMLHHQRMNNNSITFLDVLLKTIAQTDNVTLSHFGNITNR